MATNAQVIFKINADTSKAKQNLDGLDNTGKKVDSTFSKSALFSGAIGGIAATATNKIMGLFSDLTGRIIRSSDSAAKFEQTLRFAGVKDDKIKKLTESVRDFSRTSVFAVEDLLHTSALLASNGVKDADVMVKALGGVVAGVGAGREEFSSVARVYTEVTARGKLMEGHWSELLQIVPGAGKTIKKALKEAGAYTGDFNTALGNGTIKAKDFSKVIKNLGLAKAGQEAATSTKTFEGIFASINSTVLSFGKNLLKAIGEDNIKASLKSFQQRLKETLNVIKDVVEWVTSNKDLVKNVLLPASTAILGIITVLSVLAGLITTISIVATAAGGIFVAAFAAIVIVIALIIANFDSIKKVVLDVGKAIGDFFNGIGKWISETVSSTGEFFSNMFESIADGFNAFIDGIVGFFTGLVNILSTVFAPWIEFWKGMFNIWLTVVQGFINIVVGLFNILVALVQIALIPFQMLFKVIIDVIVALFRGLVDIVVEIFKFLVEGIKVVVTPIIEVFKFIGNIITSVFKGIVNVIKSMINFMVSAFKKMAKTVSGIFNGIANTIKGVFSGVVSFIKGIINGIIDGINVVISGINLIPKHTKVPKIPKLAKGGVVNRPTQALIGEAGPEAVVPLTPKGISSFMQGISRYNTGDYNNGKTTNITMNVTNNGNFDGKLVERYLTKLAKQGGM